MTIRPLLYCLVFLFTTSAQAQASTPWAAFDVLKQASDEAYEIQRDAILSSESNLEARLQRHLKSTEPNTQITARILEGWHKQSVLYTRILTEINGVDIHADTPNRRAALQEVWEQYQTRAVKEYGDVILPLAWEALGKTGRGLSDGKMAAMLGIVSAFPNVLSAQPTVKAMRFSEQADVLELAAKTLGKLPAPTVRKAAGQALEEMRPQLAADPAFQEKTRALRRTLADAMRR